MAFKTGQRVRVTNRHCWTFDRCGTVEAFANGTVIVKVSLDGKFSSDGQVAGLSDQRAYEPR